MKSNILWRLFLGVSFIFACAACTDEEESSLHEERYPYPATNFTTIQLEELQKYSGVQPVRVTQTCTYTLGRLTDYAYKQSMQASGETMEFGGHSRVSYAEQQAVVSDEEGNTYTYTLNKKGYATNCRYQGMAGDVRNWSFDYRVDDNGKHWLTLVSEELPDGTSFCPLSLTYRNNSSLRVTHSLSGVSTTFTLRASSDKELPNLSEIPSLFMAELYPLSLHTPALYGKLLGEPTPMLITQVEPDGNDVSQEQIDYSYTLDEQGIVTKCQMTTSLYEEGNTHRTSYSRSVEYSIY